MLTRFEKRLDADVVRRRSSTTTSSDCCQVLGNQEPFFFPFRRILMWARLPE